MSHLRDSVQTLLKQSINSHTTNTNEIELLRNDLTGDGAGGDNKPGVMLKAINDNLITTANNTANIKISAESVNLNTDTLESVIGADGSSHPAGVTLIGGATSSGNVKRCLVNANRELLVSGTMSLSADDNAAIDLISTKLDTVEATLTNIETDQAALEVLHTATNSKIDTIDGVLDNAEAHLGNIETAVQLLDNIVSGNEAQVDIVGALPTGSNTIGGVNISSSLPAGDNNIGNVDIASSIPAGSNNIGDVDIASALPTGSNVIGGVQLKANENVGGSGTERHVVCDSSGHLQVDVLSVPTTTISGTVSLSSTDNDAIDLISTKLDTVETTLTAIETDQAALEVLHTATNSKIDTMDAVLDNILVDTSAIKVDAAALEVLQTSTNSKLDHLSDNLDTLETTLTAIETDQAALEVLHTATNSKIDTLDAVVDNIKANTDLMTLTTTQLHNNVTIAGGSDDTNSTVITLGHNPNSITILATSASNSVPGSSITIGAMASMDNSNFFDIAQASDSGTITLVKTGDLLQEKFLVIPECRFKFLKVKITNSSGTSTQFNSFVCF